MPRRKRLTDAGIARLRAQAREYTVWDTGMAGLGVRVRPSGSRTFIYHRKTEAGIRKMSFGPAALRTVEDVRRACLAAAGVSDAGEGSGKAAPLFRDFVAGFLDNDLPRPLQAVHAAGLPRLAEAPAVAGLRRPGVSTASRGSTRSAGSRPAAGRRPEPPTRRSNCCARYSTMPSSAATSRPTRRAESAAIPAGR